MHLNDDLNSGVTTGWAKPTPELFKPTPEIFVYCLLLNAIIVLWN